MFLVLRSAIALSHSAGGCGQPDPPNGAFRQTLGKLLPCISAVHRTIDSAAGAAALQYPRITPHRPYSGKEHHWIIWIHDERADAAVLIHEQDFLPVLAAISGAEDAPVGVCSPGMSEHANIHDVGITGINSDGRVLATGDRLPISLADGAVV